MIKAIIFDLGNVLIQISFPRVLEHWSKLAGQNIDASVITCLEDEKYFEKGELTPADFRSRASAKLGFKLSDPEFDEGWNQIFIGEIPNIRRLLERLQPDFRLVVLSNTNLIHELKWRADYDHLLQYFEKVFLSHVIGARKPEEKATVQFG